MFVSAIPIKENSWQYWEISVTNESKFDALPSILQNKADGLAFISVLFCRSSLSFAESYVSQFFFNFRDFSNIFYL